MHQVTAISSKFNPVVAARVAAVFAWDLSNVKEFMVKRQGVDPTHVDEVEVEYRRYLGILAAFPEGRFPISEAVDDMWHTHLLFTHDYEQMSKATRGTFIYHEPVKNEEERQSLIPVYLTETLGKYEELYDEIPPKQYWPHSGAICWSKG